MCRIEKQDKWLLAECERRSKGRGMMADGENSRKERSWASVCLLVKQFHGMIEGYEARRRLGDSEGVGKMAYTDFLFMHSNGARRIPNVC